MFEENLQILRLKKSLLLIKEVLQRYEPCDIRLSLRHICQAFFNTYDLVYQILLLHGTNSHSSFTLLPPAVKPHTPTNVKAVSRSSGVLMVSWEPPSLPVDGLQCQFRYHSPSVVRAQPEWKVSVSEYLKMSQLTKCQL